MNVTKITIGRLYNLGNYEHVRYEISAEVNEDGCASMALTGLERVLNGLNPKCPVDQCALWECQRKAKWDDKDWQASRWVDNWRVAKQENELELAELQSKLEAWKKHQAKCRTLLDDLAGASEYKDAKLNWDDDDNWNND